MHLPPQQVQIGKMLGVPIYLHFTTALYFGMIAFGSLYEFCFMVGLFLCVLAHECGHGVVAKSHGLKLDSVMLLPIGGMLIIKDDLGFGKKLIQVGIAGPVISVAIAVALFIPSMLGFVPLDPFTKRLAIVNIGLVCFNMLPFGPLDGGHVLKGTMQLITVRRLDRRIEIMQSKLSPQMLKIYTDKFIDRDFSIRNQIIGWIGVGGGGMLFGLAIWAHAPIMGVISIFVILDSYMKVRIGRAKAI